MKRVKILLATLLTMSTLTLHAQQRNMAAVEQIARDFVGQMNATTQTDRHRVKAAALNFDEMRLIKSADWVRTPKVREAAKKNEAFYIYTSSKEQNNGFVIVSACESSTPIIGYSATGSLEDSDIPANMRYWLESFVSIQDGPSENAVRRLRSAAPRKLDAKSEVAPFVKVHWSQEKPYYNSCPLVNGERAVTGCVATAMAQAMSVYKYPSKGTGSKSYKTSTHQISVSANLANISFDWNKMRESYRSTYSAEEAKAVADLMYACGVSVEMDYTPTGSGAYAESILRALKENFGYDSDMAFVYRDQMSEDEWQQLMLDELQAGRPVLYGGSTNNREGHQFLFDGYRITDNTPYYHINWGWAGFYDTYFLMSNLDPEGAGTGGGTGAFCNDNAAVIRFMPENNKTDIGNFLQARSITAIPATVNPKTGSTFNISIGALQNCSCRDFSGSLKYYLVDSKGKKTSLGSQSIQTIAGFGGYLSSNSVKASLPSGCAYGDYTIEVYAVPSNGSGEQPVTCSAGTVRLTVSEEEGQFPVEIMSSGVIGTLVNDKTVRICAAEIMNASATPFEGSIKMALANNEGKIMSFFGNESAVSNLGHLQFLVYSREFSGTLPDGLKDGKYRIYLVASQTGYDDWHKVSLFMTKENTIVEDHIETFVEIEVKNGYASACYDDLPSLKTTVCASELTASDAGNNTVSLSVSEILNGNPNYAFVGSICVGVADFKGNITGIQISKDAISKSIDYGYYLTQPRTFSIQLPSDYPDGEYRLYILANQAGYKDWVKITKFNAADLLAGTCKELYVSVWKKDGTLYFSDPNPTDVLSADDLEDNKCYILYTDERGGLTVKTKDDTRVWGTRESGVNQEVSRDNERQHFAFVKLNGKHYLYSVAAEKFVSDAATGTLTDKPANPISFADAGNNTVRLVFDASHNINLGANKQYTCDTWKTKDAGNSFRIKIADGFTYVPSFDVAVSSADESMGTVEGSGYYKQGTTVELLAKPKTGYKFTKWSDGTTANPYTLVVNKNITLKAQFEAVYYNVTVTSSDETKGTVEGGGKYQEGASVTLKATPKEGYKFVKWSDGKTANPYTFTATKDVTLKATFEEITYTITTRVSPTNGGTVTGGGSYKYGSSVKLTATPKEGYKFVKWNDGTTANPYTFKATKSLTITATFEELLYRIEATSADATMGTVTGGGSFHYGKTVTLTATPKTGYKFVKWSDGTTANPYSFTATKDVKLTATFEINTEGIDLLTSPASVSRTYDLKGLMQGENARGVLIRSGRKMLKK